MPVGIVIVVTVGIVAVVAVGIVAMVIVRGMSMRWRSAVAILEAMVPIAAIRIIACTIPVVGAKLTIRVVTMRIVLTVVTLAFADVLDVAVAPARDGSVAPAIPRIDAGVVLVTAGLTVVAAAWRPVTIEAGTVTRSIN